MAKPKVGPLFANPLTIFATLVLLIFFEILLNLPQSPFANIPGVPSISGVAPLPDSFRVGYHEYLRTASTSDLFVAALPGVAGIAGFTLVGAYAGYRQARGLQKALLAPVPTSVPL